MFKLSYFERLALQCIEADFFLRGVDKQSHETDFARKTIFYTSFRDLQVLHTSAPLEAQNAMKC